MKIAAIGDIHGNSAALKAVLQDIDLVGVDTIINLGDHFSGPLDAAGTAELLLDREMLSIRGNHDRWLVEKDPSEMGPADLIADSQLNEVHKQWLSSLPSNARIGSDVFLCHGTPQDDLTYWMETVRSDGTVCMEDQDQIERHAIGIESSVIFCGHTHLPRLVRLKDGRLLINPGSVGCPGYTDDKPVHHAMQSGTPDALYAIAQKRNGQWSASLRSVPYDTTEMVKLAKERGSKWAHALATGWVSTAS